MEFAAKYPNSAIGHMNFTWETRSPLCLPLILVSPVTSLCTSFYEQPADACVSQPKHPRKHLQIGQAEVGALLWQPQRLWLYRASRQKHVTQEP